MTLISFPNRLAFWRGCATLPSLTAIFLALPE